LVTWPGLAGVDDPFVAVLGAGTMGLCAIAGVRRYIPNAHIIVGAPRLLVQLLARAGGGAE